MKLQIIHSKNLVEEISKLSEIPTLSSMHDSKKGNPQSLLDLMVKVLDSYSGKKNIIKIWEISLY